MKKLKRRYEFRTDKQGDTFEGFRRGKIQKRQRVVQDDAQTDNSIVLIDDKRTQTLVP